jgi:hypothetical protein
MIRRVDKQEATYGANWRVFLAERGRPRHSYPITDFQGRIDRISETNFQGPLSSCKADAFYFLYFERVFLLV